MLRYTKRDLNIPMFFIYNTLIPFLAPLWVPWMLYRAWRRKEQPNWRERMGQFHLPERVPDRPRVWLHAVSVGEVIAVLPILRELRAQAPMAEILLTVTTSSGHQTAREQAKGLFDFLRFFPVDALRFQMSAMQQVQPKVVAVMETELWMNLLWSAKVFEAQTMLINGRISDRAYPRSLRIRWFYRTLFKSLDLAMMQTNLDAERIASLGAPKVGVFGNCKFDQAAAKFETPRHMWIKDLGIDDSKPCVVVGSLRAEEFPTVGPQLRRLAESGVQVIVAPRHLERTAELQAGLGINVPQRSKGSVMEGNLLILDTYGDLASVYQVANVAVIGGGFADLGGQNLIQPLALGLPVVCGPHMQNFRDVTDMATKAGAVKVCTAEELADLVLGLLGDPNAQGEMGEAARALVAANVGASERYAFEIIRALGTDEPRG